MKSQIFSIGACLVLSTAVLAQGPTGSITVRVDHPSHPVSPTFYGLMTEEINHAYDGGLYAELLQNRTFRDDRQKPLHWLTTGAAKSRLDGDSASPYLRVSLDPTQIGGVVNEGFWGVPVRPDTRYEAELVAKGDLGFSGPVRLLLRSANGAEVYAEAKVDVPAGEWKRLSVTLHTSRSTPSANARFVVEATGHGDLLLSFASLMPPTYHHRANGNRPDIMEKLAAMRPSFLRLPGGNYLEGNTIAERFNWKETIGDVTKRTGHQGPWGYRSSDGLGLLEFLEWCEDLHMRPVLAVFAGYALNGTTTRPGPALQPYVQDAVDEIEFVTGDVSTHWGAVRAKLGHPAPFPLTYVEIGNEDNFDRSGNYDGRFTQFYDAIKAAYPKLQLIATARVHSRKPDVIDDHYYRTPETMASDDHHYDTTDRNGPKIFVGEWASMQGDPTPNLQAALGDAAFLMGLERNSDVVVMESYAPLFVNVNPGAYQWRTNLIGYDSKTSFGSPSYYVQTMFGQHAGDHVLPVDLTMRPIELPKPVHEGRIGLGTIFASAEFKDIRVTAGDETLYAPDFHQGLTDWSVGGGEWKGEDGVVVQGNAQGFTGVTGGNPHWTDYTLHVKARRTSGRGGPSISFHAIDDMNAWSWNLGGPNGTSSTLQHRQVFDRRPTGAPVPVALVDGQWLDLEVRVVDGTITCLLDGKVIHTAKETTPPVEPMHVEATRDSRTGDVILKAVNFSGADLPLSLNLDGVASVAPTGDSWVLAGEPLDQNSLSAPEKVAPRYVKLHGLDKSFVHTFPKHSVTVIRVHVPPVF